MKQTFFVSLSRLVRSGHRIPAVTSGMMFFTGTAICTLTKALHCVSKMHQF